MQTFIDSTFAEENMHGVRAVTVWLGGSHVFEYLGYAAFGVLMIGCLAYIMSALETEEAPPPRRHGPKQ